MSYFLGIDLGSTTIKTIIFNVKGEIVGKSSKAHEPLHLDQDHKDWLFWHPDNLYNSVALSCKEAISQIENPLLIKGICVTGFGMDGCPIDKNGNWLYPLISWHCSRTISQIEKLKKQITPNEIFSISGKQVMYIDTIYRLMWMKENYPDILDKTDKWLLVSDYINYRLSGSIATDYSMTWCTGLFDIKNMNWSEKLFDIIDIPSSIFPKPLQSGTKIGEITSNASKDTDILEGTPLFLGGHDYICASLATGAFKSDIIMDIMGTWEMIVSSSEVVCVDKQIFDSALNVQCSVIPDTYSTMSSFVSASMLEWFKKNYAEEEKYIARGNIKKEWDLLVGKVENSDVGSNGVFFLPHLSGSNPPYLDPYSLGAFLGLSNRVTKGDMLRAIFESLNYQFLDSINILQTTLGYDTKKIVVTGGAVHNDFWIQNKSDITGNVIITTLEEETTALGAALIAAIGQGAFKSADEAYKATFKEGMIYEPNIKKHNTYQELYGLYKEIYPTLKNFNHKVFNKFSIK